MPGRHARGSCPCRRRPGRTRSPPRRPRAGGADEHVGARADDRDDRAATRRAGSRKEATAIGVPPGSGWRSLSEPKRVDAPPARRMPTGSHHRACGPSGGLHTRRRRSASAGCSSDGGVTPWRTAVISARIATAISGGVLAPIFRPTGPCSRAISSSDRSKPARRCAPRVVVLASSRSRRRRSTAISAPRAARGRRASGRG